MMDSRFRGNDIKLNGLVSTVDNIKSLWYPIHDA
jgi:hypothetical protein